jgi:hypothetical protein
MGWKLNFHSFSPDDELVLFAVRRTWADMVDFEVTAVDNTQQRRRLVSEPRRA